MIVAIQNIYTWFSTWLSTILNINIPDGNGGYLKYLAIVLFLFQLRILFKVIKYLIANNNIGSLNNGNYKE